MFDLEFWAFVGVMAGIYSIFGAGIQLQFGFSGILNFAHVAFMAIGAYVMAILVVKTDLTVWLASAVAIATATGLSLLLALPVVRLRVDFFAITTVGFSIIVGYIILNESALTGGPIGTGALGAEGEVAAFDTEWVEFRETVETGLARLSSSFGSAEVAMLVIVWAIAVVLLAGLYAAVRSPWGRVQKAIRDDEDGARALGKNVFIYKLQSVMLGSALAAVAGLLYAFQFSYFSPVDFDPVLTFYAYAVVILGGTGRVWAVPVGALLFTIIFAGTRFFDFIPFSYLEAADRAYVRQWIIGLLLIGVIMFRPQGILGRQEESVLE